EAHNNLGITLQKQERSEEAEENFRRAIALKPYFVTPHNNLGITLNKQGRFKEAEDICRQVIRMRPDYAEAHSNLANTLQEQGRFKESEDSYRRAIALKPDYAKAFFGLGMTLLELDRFEEAKDSYQQAMVLDPEDSSAKHMLAAVTGRTTISAPEDFVEKLFDKYAANFESSLVDNLEYRIPALITEMILKDSESNMLGSIIDLGCGTGLFGKEVKQFCEELQGLDLSAKMLDKAREKNVYDKLVKQNISNFLSNENLNFDYFISTDVFVYLGDISDIFRLIKSRNKKNGKLAFSIEDYNGEGFFLEKTGRYSHSKKYIESLCEKFGYTLRLCIPIAIRKEKDKIISGAIYLLDF
ncbi:MAG: tetratricopeptide repeat protein, partial [Pseudomonadales bacterium]|nr:tetratricopeptide repeat protein [Pseudomonadales bacterium]